MSKELELRNELIKILATVSDDYVKCIEALEELIKRETTKTNKQ